MQNTALFKIYGGNKNMSEVLQVYPNGLEFQTKSPRKKGVSLRKTPDIIGATSRNGNSLSKGAYTSREQRNVSNTYYPKASQFSLEG